YFQKRKAAGIAKNLKISLGRGFSRYAGRFLSCGAGPKKSSATEGERLMASSERLGFPCQAGECSGWRILALGDYLEKPMTYFRRHRRASVTLATFYSATS